MARAGLEAPTKATMFVRGATGRCAVCGRTRLTPKWVTVKFRCDQCNFSIERNEGHFVGAVGMNTIVTFGSILITVIIGAALTAPDVPEVELSIITVAVGLVVSVLFFPISKTLWSAIDLMMVDLEPGEVDPRYDPSITLNN